MRIIDSHMHLEYGRPDRLIALADLFGYEKICILAIPCYERDVLNTLESMLAKRLAPDRVYVYGGMTYIPGREPTAADHEKQLELMMDAGCDGWKILESKPSVYRDLQLPLDSDVFSRAFAMAERESIPVKWHAGDPATFWDIKKAPPFAAERGWLCIGEGFPTLQKIYTEVENVLARYPRLKASMAHLYFTSDDRAHGERLLDTYENFSLDITPGTEMYGEFLHDREGWSAFFNRWQDKIVFGTDGDDRRDAKEVDPSEALFTLIRNTLVGSADFCVRGFSGTGLNLDQPILDKIFADNFERYTGASPRPLSKSGLNAYVEWLMPKLANENRLRAEKMLAEYGV